MKRPKTKTYWISGHVNWFDPHSGKGSIISDDGVWYRINEFSEIKDNKQRVLLQKAIVEFELADDSIHPIVKTVREKDEVAKSSKQSKRKDNKERSI